MAASRTVEQTLRGMFGELRDISDASPDVADMEPVLLRLRAYLRTNDPASEAETFLVDLVDTWPPNPEESGGIIEALEFTMHDLRWEGVRTALLRLIASDADFRVKDQARQVLEAYKEVWPGGEIYVTYREQRS